MHRYLILYLSLFFLFISCKETLPDNSNSLSSTEQSDSLETKNRDINAVPAITGLISKINTAGLPQKISEDNKLEACNLSKEEISKIFIFFWPEDVDTKTTQFLNVQKYFENEIYTFIGVEFQMNDAGRYHALNFCTYEKKSGKIISEIEGLLSSEGATDYSNGSIEITKTDHSIRLKMSITENDSEDSEISIYTLNKEGIFEQN